MNSYQTQYRKAMRQMKTLPDADNNPISFWLALPPSVNGMYATEKKIEAGKTPPRHLTAAARAWKKSAREIATMEAISQGWKCTQHSKVIIEMVAFWPDDAVPRDMNNLHKALVDALEKVIYLNDRKALIRDMDFQFDPQRPRVELTIYIMKEVLEEMGKPVELEAFKTERGLLVIHRHGGADPRYSNGWFRTPSGGWNQRHMQGYGRQCRACRGEYPDTRRLDEFYQQLVDGGRLDTIPSIVLPSWKGGGC